MQLKMIELTEYETGNTVLLRPEFILAIRELSANVLILETIAPVEHGQRTLINLRDKRQVLVTQTASEIAALIAELDDTPGECPEGEWLC